MSHLPNTQTKTQSAALFPRVRPSGAGSTCCRGAETDTCVSPRAGAGQVRGRCEAGPGRCTEGASPAFSAMAHVRAPGWGKRRGTRQWDVTGMSPSVARRPPEIKRKEKESINRAVQSPHSVFLQNFWVSKVRQPRHHQDSASWTRDEGGQAAMGGTVYPRINFYCFRVSQGPRFFSNVNNWLKSSLLCAPENHFSLCSFHSHNP